MKWKRLQGKQSRLFFQKNGFYQNFSFISMGIVLFSSILSAYISIATDRIPRGLFYNSDALYIPMFYQDMFSDYSLWGWIHPPAPYFFPDIALYSLINFTLGNFHLAVMGFGVVQILLTLIVLIWISRKAFGTAPGITMSILAAGSSLVFLLASGNYNAFLPILQNGYHFGAFLSGLTALAITLTILEKNELSRRAAISWTLLLGILTTCTFMSDAIYAVQIILPLGATILCFSFLGLIPLKSQACLYFALLPPIFLGALLNRLVLIYRIPQQGGAVLTSGKIVKNLLKAGTDLVSWRYFDPQYLSIFHGIWIAFLLISLVLFSKFFRKALLFRKNSSPLALVGMYRAALLWGAGLLLVVGHLFFRWPFWLLITGSLVVGILLLLLAKKIPPLAPGRKIAFNSNFLFILTFFITCVLTNIGAVAILGKAIPRRLIPALLIPLFFGWPFLLGGSRKIRLLLARRHVLNVFSGIVLVFTLTLNMQALLYESDVLTKLTDFYPELVACLDEHTREYDVHFGLAQYWYARKISMLSKNDLHVVHVRHGSRSPLVPEHWIANYNWYNEQFEFVITEANPRDHRNIYGFRMQRFFGSPAHVFKCDKKRIFVYNRPKDTRFQHQFDKYFGFDLSAAELPSEIGRIEGTSRIAEFPSDSAGALTYGPYMYFHIGTYAFEIHSYAENEQNEAVGKWEIVTYPEKTFETLGAESAQVIKKGNIQGNGTQIISGTFKIQDYNLKTELRILYKGKGLLRVDKLLVRRIH